MVFGPFYTARQAYRDATSFEQKESRLLLRMARAIESSPVGPKVVLLGSSVVATPFFLLDYDPLKPSDYFERNCDVKAMDVSMFAGKPNSVFSMGTDAAMVSDCYFLARKYLLGAHKPQVLVLGLTPRDFSDSYPLNPNESMVFRYLAELKDFVWASQVYLVNFDDVAKFFLNRTVSLFAERPSIQGKVVDRLLLIELKFLGPNIKAVNQSPDTRSFIPDERERWEVSRKEYVERYQHLDKKRIDSCFKFLRRLLRLCVNNKIHVIVVNMPLSAVNVNLLPTGFYEKFEHDLEQTAAESNAEYIDCHRLNLFHHDDFFDTAHLNQNGAVKLSEQLKPLIFRRAQ